MSSADFDGKPAVPQIGNLAGARKASEFFCQNFRGHEHKAGSLHQGVGPDGVPAKSESNARRLRPKMNVREEACHRLKSPIRCNYVALPPNAAR